MSVESQVADLTTAVYTLSATATGLIGAANDTVVNAGNAALAAGIWYANTSAGIAATTNGQYFAVIGDGVNTFSLLYRNTAGVAVFVSKLTDKSAFDAAMTQFLSIKGLLYQQVGSIQTVGRPNGSLVTGAAFGSVTTCYGDPVEVTGYLGTVRLWATATGTLKVRRFTRAGDVFTQVGTDLVLTWTGSGLKPFSVEAGDFLPWTVNAGEYLGFYSTVLAFVAGQTDSRGIFNSATGDVTSFTDTAVSLTNIPQIGYDIYRFNTTTALEATNRKLATSVADAVAGAVGVKSLRLIGKSFSSPSTGSSPAANTFIIGTGLELNGVLKTVQCWSNGAGFLRIRRYTEAVRVFTRVPNVPDLVLPLVTGFNTFSADLGHFTPMVMLPGEYLGFFANTLVHFIATPATSGGYFSAAGDLDVVSLAAFAGATTTIQLQIQFGVEVVDPYIGKPASTMLKTGILAAHRMSLAYGRCAFIGTGQSLQQAANADPPLNVVPSLVHKMPGVGVKMTMPGLPNGTNADDLTEAFLVEDTHDSKAGDSSGETMMSEFCRSFSNEHAQKLGPPPVWFPTVCGQSATAISGLMPSSALYPNLEYHITRGKALADLAGVTYGVSAFDWAGCETDQQQSVPTAVVKDRLLDQVRWSNYRARVLAPRMKYNPIWFMTTPVAYITVSPCGNDAILQLCDERPDCFAVMPNHRLPHGYAAIHLSNVGQQLRGHFTRRAAIQHAQGNVPGRCWWRGVIVNGTTVTAWISAPTPCRFANLIYGQTANTTDRGIKIVDDAGTLVLSGITTGTAIHNNETGLWDTPVVATVHRPLTTNRKFRYARDYICNGITLANGATGDLCDNTLDVVTLGGAVHQMVHGAFPVELDISIYE